MKAYLQVLSTGTADCPPSIILHFDSQRYMINCGEGTQRLCMESKLRFAKLKTILLTRTHWDCMGGIPGMLLTLSDVGIRNMKVLGGENLTHALISTRHFVFRNTMSVETVEFSNESWSYKDENLRITAVQIYPENFERAAPIEWPALAKPSSFKHTQSSSPSEPPTTSTVMEAPTTAGSKRSSDELQSSSTDAPAVEEMDDSQIRKQILAGMFNLDRFNETAPLQSKKLKRDDAAQTDVDMIEAAQAAEADSCDQANKKNVREHVELPRTSPNTSAICYICQSPDYAGKFNKQAAIDLNIKPGILFSQLVRGQSVLSESGDVVHPHQVIDGARPGRVFMVIDCPSVEYVAGLVSAKDFERFHGSESVSENNSDKLKANCIVHMGGHSVLSHPEYKAWMERFGPETQHIIANQEYCSQKLIWMKQSKSCYKLSKLDSSIFPIPYYENEPIHNLTADLEGVPVKATLAESMQTFLLEPSIGLEMSEVIKPLVLYEGYEFLKNNSEPYLQEYYELTEKAQEEIARCEEAYSEEIPGKDVVLTSLGTGSSHPSRYRNVSATLLEIPKDGTFLLDAGEGTYGQMFRQFGGFRRSEDQANSVDDRIKNLKGVFISHLHADHHLGIVTVIDRWNKLREANSKPLYLVAPRRFNTFLQELSDVQDFGYHNVQFVECEDIVYWRDSMDRRKRDVLPVWNEMLESTGFEEISTVDVIHCPWSYGISMTHKDGWKIVYSGDTRPCQNLVDAGSGATVLLHEATFEDNMKAEALKKKHSTTQEAITVGEGMEAKYTLLTHFSQRYPKIPQFDSENKSTVIGICFDLMSVRLGQIARLQRFLPALQVLYSPQSEEAQEGEEENRDSEIKKLQQQAE